MKKSDLTLGNLTSNDFFKKLRKKELKQNLLSNFVLS